VGVALLASPLAAAPMEARVKLRDGKLQTADVSRVLLESFHLKGVELNVGSIDMTGLRGATFCRALKASLGDGCNIEVAEDALILHFDPAKLPRSFSDAKLATRIFTATAAPDATAAQRRSYGLLLPKHVDPQRRMAVLVHGLDCHRSNWYPMADLLVGEGFQIAYFTYPSDGPLEESAKFLADEMTALRDRYPDVPLDVIAHSMGGLVARRYVEGDAYGGGMRHLILLGTPNQGSSWAAYRIALEAEEHFGLWKHEKDWSPSWMITDGLGEAGRDLKPTSRFLKELNSRPRREGVAYTIVAGSHHPIYSVAGDALNGCANVIPDRAAGWWGFRQTESALRRGAVKMRTRSGKSDGPVNLSSTQLEGVEDHVVLPADHTGLYYPTTGEKPAAWEIIRNRLGR
jgi:pimeloyl-ACP methyl ester carboxylesterase